VGDTVFKNSKFKFQVVEDANGSKIIQRFERLSALKRGGALFQDADNKVSRWDVFGRRLEQGLLDQTQGFRTGLRSLAQKIKNLPTTLADGFDSFVGLLKTARKGIGELGDSLSLAKRSVSEWLQTGKTVKGLKFEQTKVIVAGFADVTDPATNKVMRVAQYKTVLREDIAGTSYAARLRQFRETWGSTKIKDPVTGVKDPKWKIVKSVEETVDATGQVRRTIQESKVLRESWVKKLNKVDEPLIKYDNTKIVRGYREIQLADGTSKLESTIKEVYRERYLRTSYTDKAKDFFGLTTGTVGKRFLNIGTNETKTEYYKYVRQVVERQMDNGQVRRALEDVAVDRLHVNGNSYRAIISDAAASAYKSAAKSAGEAVDAAWLAVKAGTKKAGEKLAALPAYLKTDEGIKTVGRVLDTSNTLLGFHRQIDFALDHFTQLFNPGDWSSLSDQYSAQNPNTSYKSPFRFNVGGVTTKAGLLASVIRQAMHGYSAASKEPPPIGPFVVHGHPEREIGTTSYDNRTSSDTFVSQHERQWSWIPTSWTDTAASATTQIYSSFGIDRAASLQTAIVANQMLSGQVGQFNSSSVAGFALGAVGHMSTNPIPNPINFLDAAPPNPRG
jgi:hypothetical protein